MNFINNETNLSVTSTNLISNSNTSTDSSGSTKNFLDYIVRTDDDVSLKDLQIQEQILEVLEEIVEQNEENLFDSLVNNLVDYYIEESSVVAQEDDTIEKLAEVVDELENSHWFRL